MYTDVYFIAMHDYATQQVDEIELIQGITPGFLFEISL